MKKIFYLLLIISSVIYSQNKTIEAEILLGKINTANSLFPDLKIGKTATIFIGKHQTDTLTWIKKLNYPTTGLAFQFNDHGNPEKIGYSFSILPYIEKPIFLKSRKLKLNSAIGLAYHTKKHHESLNWQNKAISTDFTWTYRMGINYDFFNYRNLHTNLAINYIHFSNGHVKWPNNGINSFSAGIKLSYDKYQHDNLVTIDQTKTNKSSNSFIAFQPSIGQHSLYRFYNFSRNVYALDIQYGKIFNEVHKVGVSLYFRNYVNNYEYIKEGNNLVTEEYTHLKSNPFLNSSSLGIGINYEYLMKHIAIESELGFTIFRPFYEAEYRLNNTLLNKETNEYEIGEAKGLSYNLKRVISGKLGLKYYLINTIKKPKNNLYVGTHIVSNLGQADFTEFSIGYIHLFK